MKNLMQSEVNSNSKISVNVKGKANIKEVDLRSVNTRLLENDANYRNLKTGEKDENIFDHLIHSIEYLEFDAKTGIFILSIKKMKYELDTLKNELSINNIKKSKDIEGSNEKVHQSIRYYAYGKESTIPLYRIAAILYEIIEKKIIRTTYTKVTINHTRNDSQSESQYKLDLNTLEITDTSCNSKHWHRWNYIHKNSVNNIQTDFLSTNEEFMEKIDRFKKAKATISESDLINLGAKVDKFGVYVIR